MSRPPQHLLPLDQCEVLYTQTPSGDFDASESHNYDVFPRFETVGREGCRARIETTPSPVATQWQPSGDPVATQWRPSGDPVATRWSVCVVLEEKPACAAALLRACTGMSLRTEHGCVTEFRLAGPLSEGSLALRTLGTHRPFFSTRSAIAVWRLFEFTHRRSHERCPLLRTSAVHASRLAPVAELCGVRRLQSFRKPQLRTLVECVRNRLSILPLYECCNSALLFKGGYDISLNVSHLASSAFL
ncbi:hypothetical protein MRX96_004940 [Rhipicephalus microplus]